MYRCLSLYALLMGSLLAASCSQQQVQPVKKPVRSPVYAGRVERVYPQYKYVLIALAGNVYEPGTVLISQSPSSVEGERVANLVVSAEKVDRLRVPADIRSGAVEVGDLVFLYQNLAVPESTHRAEDPSVPPGSPEKKEVTPPMEPKGAVTPDGLVPLPGQGAGSGPESVLPSSADVPELPGADGAAALPD